uniref:Uncharacterized protein n=1 Tax=Panagrolaimus sp. JU765 TaxID=591449 RepID=A0AC34QDX3_9BILA
MSTVLYAGYLIIWWRMGENIYNAYVIWAFGTYLGSLIVLKPVTVCFLGLDRCLALIIPMEHRAHPAKWIVIPTMIAVGVFFVVNFMFFILPAFPPAAKTTCGAILCLAPNHAAAVYTTLRYISSAGILMIGIAFVISARKRFFDTTAVAKYTRLVFKIILLSFFFDFIPHTLTFVLYMFFQINIAVYLGPYSTFFSSMESFGCSIFYYQIMKTQVLSSNVTSQQTFPSSQSSQQHKKKTFLR